MNIWIITDTHFSHEKMITYGRPSNFEEQIKNNLKRLVKKDDILIHLGDICIGNDTPNNNWFKENLGCKTYLLLGNHDNKSISWYMNNGWDVVAKRIDIDLFKKRICFTHIPVAWDGYFDINVHGHFHTSDRRRFEPEWAQIISGYNRLLSIEENGYKPVLLQKFIM